MQQTAEIYILTLPCWICSGFPGVILLYFPLKQEFTQEIDNGSDGSPGKLADIAALFLGNKCAHQELERCFPCTTD